MRYTNRTLSHILTTTHHVRGGYMGAVSHFFSTKRDTIIPNLPIKPHATHTRLSLVGLFCRSPRCRDVPTRAVVTKSLHQNKPFLDTVKPKSPFPLAFASRNLILAPSPSWVHP
ncbi:MAG: hypothetical protein NZL83_04060 [Candidatus Absconditabacterales bacterium]|nr:hypothetical protein [Candidatus Absconditabacterales bacterium]